VSDEARSGRSFLRPIWGEIDLDHSDQALGVRTPDKVKPAPAGVSRVCLPPMEKWPSNGVPLIEALLRRQSRRHFSSQSLSLEELSLLLFCTQGIRKMTPNASFRTSPSAGARHSFETYLYVDRVGGLARGLYRYLPDLNEVYVHRASTETMATELNEALFEQLYGAAVCFIWTAIPYRMEWRYRSASPKLIAIDAGHICENLYLAVEAIGAGTCAIGAYDQRMLDGLLGIDGTEEFAFYVASVGKAA
jgi:SagB-type dehydrogenase family enzyme